MLSKKYIRILLGALCVFLLLSLVSNFVVEPEIKDIKEGFADTTIPVATTVTQTELDAFKKVTKKVVNKLASGVNQAVNSDGLDRGMNNYVKMVLGSDFASTPPPTTTTTVTPTTTTIAPTKI